VGLQEKMNAEQKIRPIHCR